MTFFRIYYAEDWQWHHRKRTLGINFGELPSMAFNMLDRTKIVWPQGKKITEEAVMEWCDAVLSLEPSVRTVPEIDIVDKEIASMTKVDIPESLEVLADDSLDHILFVYSSERVWDF